MVRIQGTKEHERELDLGILLTALIAYRRGDFSTRMPIDWTGVDGKIADTLNEIIDMAKRTTDEYARVSQLVGKDGHIDGRLSIADLQGAWSEQMKSSNTLIQDLVNPLSEIARVIDAVSSGDLSQKVPTQIGGKKLEGDFFESANVINAMVDQLAIFSSEVTRVTREVGEGTLGGQANVKDVSGIWKDVTENVNFMADSLAVQLRDVSKVATAIAQGDLGQRITVDVKGEILQIKDVINTMVDQLAIFSSEVTRVTREVGEGTLGGQANVKDVSGIWKDVTENVNFMADSLAVQLRDVSKVATAIASGDLGQRITVDVKGEILQIKDVINTMVDQLSTFSSEVTRVTREVGEGTLGGQANVKDVSGIWKDVTENVNFMAANLTVQLRDVSKVATAIAQGDLGQRITVDVKGEILQIKDVINTMVDQLSTFSSEVTRVTREVGEGTLGGQANVKDVSGIWKDVTENVNFMAGNLTVHLRDVSKVATAIASGDLGQRITVDVKGEILQIKDVINTMVDQLSIFSSEVTRVTREVGEGKLGGEADVKDVSGIWKDVTENVNFMAANLTAQVRAIAGVATAVTKGDLTRSVTLEAKGEVAALKDNVNEMIRNLRETTNLNSEQDWLKTNLGSFASILQGQRDLTAVSKAILSKLAPLVEAHQGVFYLMDTPKDSGEARLTMLASYAYKERKNIATEWKVGEGLVGQCALEKTRILLTNVPDDYIQISSGLGEAKPLNIILLPIIFEDKVKAVIELASFKNYSAIHQTFLDQFADSIGIVLNTIEANMLTEELLKQSQSLTNELQSQQEELRQSNDELEEKAHLLEEQKMEVEIKNREVGLAKAAVEEKAAQLELTSKYKSEFLSNMSHELRTPLNSLLILAQQLAENSRSHLDPKEVEFAKLIEVSGNDLLSLINEILDLSKIESGTVSLNVSPVPFALLHEQIESAFQHIAKSRNVNFKVSFARDLPAILVTDEMRLLQVIKNLLSNAFKFTDKGEVSIRVTRATAGWNSENEYLNGADEVFAFTVEDTGIGISTDKQHIIFEAFQQGDGRTARKYGGTGLGLSISREIAHLLGGELKLVTSALQEGSIFVLYIPQHSLNDLSEPDSENAPAQLREESTNSRETNSIEGLRLPDWTPQAKSEPEISDDRLTVRDEDRTLLIIEDDPAFANIILELAREKGFKGIVSMRGLRAVELARSHKPDAITLDIHIPDIDGWTVLNMLKTAPDLRHIPVSVITIEDDPIRGLVRGALQYLVKPVTRVQIGAAMDSMRSFIDRPIKSLLLVTSDTEEQKQITRLLVGEDMTVEHAAGGKMALAALREKHFDCVVSGMKLTDMRGTDFISAMRKDKSFTETPVVAYSGVPLTNTERSALKRASTLGVVKSVDSLDSLFDQTALFLHRVVSKLPKEKLKLFEQLQQATNVLGGKKVLIVDDDVRNIFALTAALELKGMTVSSAERGAIALKLLKEMPDIDLVLMDIMMPEMDGYETMREIRKLAKFKKLPIIALTAKAMVGDRDKCIDAGASDYLSKPVNIVQLSSLMQVWISK